MAAVFMTACAVVACEQVAPPKLMLQERVVHELPDSFDLLGASADHEAVVAWALSTADLLVLRADRAPAYFRDPRVMAPLGAVPLQDGGVEVIDAGAKRLWQFNPDGSVFDGGSIALPGNADGAVRLNGTWHVSAFDTVAQEATVHRVTSGGMAKVFSARRAGNTDDPQPRLTLSVANGYLVVMRRHYPFEATVLDTTGAVVRTFSSGAAVAMDTSEVWAAREAFSLPLVAIDGGFLQTISNATSFRRKLLTLDANGAVLRSVSVDGPIGFIAAGGPSGTVWAFRNINRPELVGYDMHWAATAPEH